MKMRIIKWWIAMTLNFNISLCVFLDKRDCEVVMKTFK